MNFEASYICPVLPEYRLKCVVCGLAGSFFFFLVNFITFITLQVFSKSQKFQKMPFTRFYIHVLCFFPHAFLLCFYREFLNPRWKGKVGFGLGKPYSALQYWLLALSVMQAAWQQLCFHCPGWEPAVEEADMLGTPAGFPASVSLLPSIFLPLPCHLSPESVTCLFFHLHLFSPPFSFHPFSSYWLHSSIISNPDSL